MGALVGAFVGVFVGVGVGFAEGWAVGCVVGFGVAVGPAVEGVGLDPPERSGVGDGCAGRVRAGAAVASPRGRPAVEAGEGRPGLRPFGVAGAYGVETCGSAAAEAAPGVGPRASSEEICLADTQFGTRKAAAASAEAPIPTAVQVSAVRRGRAGLARRPRGRGG
ncbi:hypothetical protein MPTA5024_28950, partial [Microbispora sp. ATCC PTA-5024]